jgi:hemerythrin-like metal-binding protein
MTNDLALGDPRLDADHAEIQRLTERLAEAPPAGLVDALQALRDHASEHFAIEDQDLREMKDGNASCHLDEHAAVLASLAAVCERVGPAPAAPESQDMVSRLVAELRRWLPEHVQQMDAAVATSRTKKRLGGAPVVLSRRI